MHKDANRIRLYTKYDNLVEEGAKDGTQDQSQIEEYMNQKKMEDRDDFDNETDHSNEDKK